MSGTQSQSQFQFQSQQQQSVYASGSRYPDHDDDSYDNEQPSYPPPQSQFYNPAYATDPKSPPRNDFAHPDPPYPLPRTSQPYPFDHSAPTLRPSMSAGMSTHSLASKGPFASNVDLESIATHDDPDRPIHMPKDLKKADAETGWKAALWPASRPSRMYIMTVVIETVIDVVIEGTILQQLDAMQDTVPQKTGDKSVTLARQPVYLGIFVLAHVLQMVLAVDAVYNKNTLQFLFLAFFNFSLLVYGALQVVEVQSTITSLTEAGATAPSIPTHVLTILVPIVIAIAEVAYIGLGYQIWKEFGWKVYKFLGADRTIKKIYGHYQIFECLLKFDVFFWVGFSIQWISLVLVKNSDFEFYATIIALPISILLLVEGHLAARHENRWMMYGFMVGCVAGCAYFAFKAYRILQVKNDPEWLHLWKSLLIFAVLSILLLLTTFISSAIVLFNFNGGLKESMNKKVVEQKLQRRATNYHKNGLRQGKSEYPPPAFSSKRMSIE